MKAGRKSGSNHATPVMAVAMIGMCWLHSAAAADDVAVDDADASARADWSEFMSHNSQMTEGCFRAVYPSVVWESVQCKEAHPLFHPIFGRKPKSGEDVAGDGIDYVASAAGLITEAIGTFPTVSGVKSESGVGVASFGGGGILGPNEYTLQINSNYTSTTSACAGHTGCTVWQQFIYAPDYNAHGEAAVFMQYWLLAWGSTECPVGWGADGHTNCYKNSLYVAAPDVAITSLGKLRLSGIVVAGGKDTVVFNDGNAAYSISGSDGVLQIASVWRQSEFNVVGNGGGSRAEFNKGSSITVRLALKDGSTSAPVCVADAGSTGETNNLDLGPCSASGGPSPAIQFTEKD